MFEKEGKRYDQYIVVDSYGVLRAQNGKTSKIPYCVASEESLRKFAPLLPEGRGRCARGCHDVFVTNREEPNSDHLRIYVAESRVGPEP